MTDFDRLLLKKVSAKLKHYVDHRRREEGWHNDKLLPAGDGHAYDHRLSDNLGHYFANVRQDPVAPSDHHMRNRHATMNRSRSELYNQQEREFEARRQNVVRDMETLIHREWVKDEKFRSREVVGTNSPWKIWASSRTFGEMLEMNDPWYRAHHEHKVRRRRNALPEHCFLAWSRYKAEYPSPALYLGTQALFDMVAEATVDASNKFKEQADFRVQGRRTSMAAMSRKASLMHSLVEDMSAFDDFTERSILSTIASGSAQGQHSAADRTLSPSLSHASGRSAASSRSSRVSSHSNHTTSRPSSASSKRSRTSMPRRKKTTPRRNKHPDVDDHSGTSEEQALNLSLSSVTIGAQTAPAHAAIPSIAVSTSSAESEAESIRSGSDGADDNVVASTRPLAPEVVANAKPAPSVLLSPEVRTRLIAQAQQLAQVAKARRDQAQELIEEAENIPLHGRQSDIIRHDFEAIAALPLDQAQANADHLFDGLLTGEPRVAVDEEGQTRVYDEVDEDLRRRWFELVNDAMADKDAIMAMAAQYPSLSDTRDNHGRTALMIACHHGRQGLVEALLSNPNPSLLRRDNRGASCAHFAAAQGRLQLLQYLHQQRVDLTVTTHHQVTVLHMAVFARHVPTVAWLCTTVPSLLTCQDDQGMTPLELAKQQQILDASPVSTTIIELLQAFEPSQ
eukprot:TRINITY_DN7205_c0_g1_i4.p1 TRINITY_DN7205_c0_g1~~TRINITY_DN7205_c0_g1_i4.p1  ORF type:complete len:679 (+),score=146.96 TRINITY_DN7205_c0_g1_i4:97-2133(+)